MPKGRTNKQPKADEQAGFPSEAVGTRQLTRYDPNIGLEMCERIAEGETLSNICKEDRFPARQTFHRWLVNHPELNRAYASAREISAHSMEEEAVDMARKLKRGEVSKDQIRAFDVAINQLRWSASKRNAQVYSEKAQNTFTVPIQINTGLDLGSESASSAPDHPNIYRIEANVEAPNPSERGEDTRVDASEVRIEAEKRLEKPDEPLVAPQSNRQKAAKMGGEARKKKSKTTGKREAGRRGFTFDN